MQTKLTRNLARTGGSLAGLAIVFCIAVAANVLIGSIPLRVDLTEEKLYTLSEGTRRILKNLDGEVTLKFFFNSSDPQVPMHIKNFAGRVQDLLAEYRIASGNKVHIETLDPKPDSDAEEWAQKYGVMGQSVGFMGPTLYIGLVAVMGDSESVLPVIDPQADALLEYNVTRMITRVANPRKPVVGVLSSLGVLGAERPMFPMPGQPPGGPAWFAFQDLKQDYDVRRIEATVERIDDDVDALVVVHPKELNDTALYAIDQFVLRGGRLLAFLDAMSLTESESQADMPPQMRFQPKSSNMEKLLSAWGVTFETSKVVADVEASTRLRVGADGRVEETPVWLSLRREAFAANDILTDRIESILMPYAGAFTVNAPAGVEVTSLIASSKNTGMVDAMMAQFSLDSVRRNFKSEMARKDLAVRLRGKLKTAFPDGKPKSEDKDAEKKDEPPADKEEPAAADSLKESKDGSTVILVADSDMLYDRFCVQQVNFLMFKSHQPMNDNLAFFFNAVEQMAGNTDLIGIRTRGKSDRPFTVVLDLQKKAQDRYLDQERRLQETLEAAEKRLNELQSQKEQGQAMFLSAKQKELIAETRQEVSRTKRELKLVRRKLREDIERLGTKVKLLNILLMPALVTATGIGVGVYRKTRTRD